MNNTINESFKKYLLFSFLLLLPITLYGQNVSLSGTVIDDGGQPIIGAAVMENGTTNGTVTDLDGHFILEVKGTSSLTVSYMGYVTQQIPVKNRHKIQVTLKEDAILLEETIVVGYGTMKKSDMTGAISSVDVDQLANRTTTNPAEALQGKVAGVNILKSSGQAGAGVSVKIRGVKTFGSNEPLYIIDGFPGDIENVSPQDIESLEVLKDGAAAAIYGSVAANGVIIITTKSGKKGEVKVDFSTYLSFTDIAKQLNFLDADGYKSMHKAMYDNWNGYATETGQNLVTIPEYVNKDTGVDSDWQKAMQRSGFTQNYTLSIRGGSDQAKYSISYNHSDEKGIFLGNNFRQDNARTKLQMTKGIFDFETNMSFKFTDSKYPQYSLKEMYMISPLVPIYDSEQQYGYGLTNFDGLPSNRNVMADHHYKDSKNRKYHTTANASVTVNFTDWLNFRTSYAYRGEHERNSFHTPKYIADVKSKREYPYNSESTAYWQEQIIDNILSFNKAFNKHSLNAMLGSSITAQKYQWNSIGVEGKTTVYQVKDGKLASSEEFAGFLDENFPTIDAGKGGTYDGSGSYWKYNRASFFGRLNYNYDNRYLVQGTMRYDGSSKFGSDNRWGVFPSLALGWRISEEAFFPKDIVLNNLKLRMSWGKLGNENALGKYDFQAIISTYNTKYQGYVKGNGENPWPGSIARGLENRTLKWETTDSKNLGLDLGFFDNALTLGLNYYINTTKDLLIYKVLPPSSGLQNPILNVGEIENKGFELEAEWNHNVNDFHYNVGFNLFTTRNRVKALSSENQVITGEGLKYGTEHYPTETRVGRPIGAFYLYKTAGIFQSMEEVQAHVNEKGELLQPNARPGDLIFVDTNKDGSINDDDKYYAGSGIPKLEASLNLGASYKGFDISMVFGSGFGNKLYNANKYYYEGMNSGSNFLKSSLNAWTPENKNTSVPRAIYQDPNGNTRESDRFLEKGDFLKMRQLQIGYSLPKMIARKAYMERCRVYVSAENLFTITSYDGVDPEFSRGVLNAGVDKLIFPFTRSFTVGAQISF